ncbi:hypothetical protein BDV27DRAFT_122373 [Aspergillus caelatus]|uniref:Uncharacterized protein n=1 Tax=Aspergillus caelatus TaxID=61420 RepID=A0A5N7AGR4_9EURO|nr:uncharacterized protein BDV27DRAFT_122373 [Aspergillus caelatus]KAE8368478.1 hypothetical protein BDV27DRAFT_122373 [Aspergillus caelatus]
MSSPKIKEISRPEIENLGMNAASISDVRHLLSYNWIDASVPTIAVPGRKPHSGLQPVLTKGYLNECQTTSRSSLGHRDSLVL